MLTICTGQKAMVAGSHTPLMGSNAAQQRQASLARRLGLLGFLGRLGLLDLLGLLGWLGLLGLAIHTCGK